MGIIIPMLVAAFFALYLAWTAWHRWPVRGARPFAVLMLAAAIWAIGYALELITPALPDKILWGKIQYLGIAVIPGAWLAFSLRYTAIDDRLERPQQLIPLLSIQPAVTLLLAWTYPFTRLLWSDVQLSESGGLWFARIIPGCWYWINVAYSYTLLIVGLAIIIRGLKGNLRSYRWQSLTLVVAIAAPWIGNVLYMLGLPPFGYLDLTPIGFVVGGFAIALGLFRFQLLNLTPVVRDRVVEALQSAYVVVGQTGHILDFNRAAIEWLCSNGEEAPDRPVSEVLPGLPNLRDEPEQPVEALEEMVWTPDGLRSIKDSPPYGPEPVHDPARYTEVRISPIFGRGGGFIGHLVMLSDITERALAEWMVLANKAELERLISERTSEIQSVNLRLREQIRARSRAERDLADRVSELESLYKVGQSVIASLSVKEVTPQAVTVIQDVCDTDLTVIYRRDGEQLKFLDAGSREGIATNGHGVVKRVSLCLCGKAAQMREPLYSDHIQQDVRCELEECRRVGIRSFAALPMVVGGDMLGVLGLGSLEERDFSAQAQFLEALAVEVGLGLRNALLYQESQQRLAELGDEIAERKRIETKLQYQNVQLTTLNKVAAITSQELDIASALRATLDELLELPGLDAIWLQNQTLLDDQQESLRLSGSVSGTHIPDLAQTYGTEMDVVVATRKPHVVSLPPDGALEGSPMSLVLVPVQARESMLGVLAALCSPQLLDIEGIVSLLHSAGNQIGLAVENAQLLELIAQIEAREELDRLRSDLIANVSHEIRTPLGLIKLFATTLQMRDPRLDPRQQGEFLDGIVEQTEDLEKIVEDLLSLGSYESGKLRLDRRRLDLRRIVSDLIGSMRLELRQHRVVRDYAPYALVVNADPHRIDQVLRNLLSNAIKYSSTGSKITLRAYQYESEAVVCVEDEGVGIPVSAQPHIFERFYRVDNDATSRTRGAGLGLSISRAIVEAHGGRIWFESVPGYGSTFYLALPLAQPVDDGGNPNGATYGTDDEIGRGMEESADV
ncbi:MAG: histidine kinase N-terminal 7TM domain-containing protein [Anaerolineae bacterium]